MEEELDVEDIMFENSPLAQYLKSLNQPELGDIDVVSLGEVLEGVIPEEQQIREGIRNSSAKNARTFSQTETDQAKISLQDRGIKKETYKDSLRKFLVGEDSQPSLQAFQHFYFEEIINSNLLHPNESPYFSVPYQTPTPPSDNKVHTAKLEPLSFWSFMASEWSLDKRRTFDFIVPVALALLAPFLLPDIISGTIAFVLIAFLFLRFHQNMNNWKVLKTHQQNHELLKNFMDKSKLHDQVVQKAIRTIQETELIAHGYKLSTPLSPITRLEHNFKSKKAQVLRQKTLTSICKLISLLESTIGNINGKWESLSQLCEEYQLRMFDLSDLSLANLKTATYLYFFLRSHLLTSLLNSINTSDSSLNGFAKFGSVLKPVVNGLNSEIEELQASLNTQLIKPALSNSTLKEERTVEKSFLHAANELKHQMETIIARVNLCELSLIDYSNHQQQQQQEGVFGEIIANHQQVKAELISALEMWEVTNKYLNRIAGNLDNENSNLTPINIQQAFNSSVEDKDSDVPAIDVRYKFVDPTAELLVSELTFEAYTGPESDKSDEEDEESEVIPTMEVDTAGGIPPPPPPPLAEGIPPPPPPMGLPSKKKKKKKTKSREERIEEKKKKQQEKEEIQQVREIFDEYELKKVIQELKDVLLARTTARSKQEI